MAEHLRASGVEVRERVGKTGVVGLVRGRRPGRTILVRADMDGLPLTEQNPIEYASATSGAMHA
ncbi:MAG: hypothetical protein HYV08_11175 [Deltaproteobacteria bacterium]|nr:hypothetical protein [Deltaproteobacteria bacterium]